MTLVRTKSWIGRGGGCFLFLCVLAFAGRIAEGAAVWIDTDSSIGAPFREVDDAFALVLAFHSPELEIAGISTSYGNAPLRVTTRVAARLVAQFASKKIPVFAGATSPSDLGRSTPASEGLRLALQKHAHLTYIAIGPLTNLATFLTLHPALAPRIDRVIFVGGETSSSALRFGRNHGWQIHDANVYKDTGATRRILQSGVPLTLAPVQSSPALMFNLERFEMLRGGGSAAKFLYRKSRVWFWFWTRIVGSPGAPPFDALAALCAAHPELTRLERRFAQLDEAGHLIIAVHERPGSRAVRCCSPRLPGAESFVVERLSQSR